MKRQTATVKLRRKSQRILQWFFATLLLALGALAVNKMGFAGPNKAQVGLTACFASIFLIQRISRRRILISQGELRIVNAIFEYRVACAAVAQVLVDTGGNLRLKTAGGEEIYVAAYSGSLIDHFVGSSDRAAETIRRHMPKKTTSAPDSAVHRRLAVSWLSEIWLAAAAAFGVWTAVAHAVG
ncbi:hypothetical protein AB0G35_25440 [Streptomyces sp. NPDC021749]|uniref:hypothetical protein n=1 Tax=Streptomyces sp. NPDC021749 TaxID=3154905 RepID=UPI0033FCFF09